MKNTLTFTTTIRCPRQRVWEIMFSPDGYRAWTAPFMEGSYYSGSWEQGQKIQFLSPGGEGMTAVIAENRPHEFLSIRHLGEIRDGVEDTTSDKVRAWAPAYENYSLEDVDGGTELTVNVDTVAEYVDYMKDTFPKALEALKTLCEGAPR
jgi:uncharacterized protein YndB with AHSA1/START domain